MRKSSVALFSQGLLNKQSFKMEIEQAAKALKELGHPTRLNLFKVLVKVSCKQNDETNHVKVGGCASTPLNRTTS